MRVEQHVAVDVALDAGRADPIDLLGLVVLVDDGHEEQAALLAPLHQQVLEALRDLGGGADRFRKVLNRYGKGVIKNDTKTVMILWAFDY